MGENSKIQWTHHTFNPWIGCTKVHEGCAHCYAERDMDHHWQKAKWGPSGTRVITSDENWRKPLKWNKEAAAAGERRRVFCASLADVFESWQGEVHDHLGNLLVRPYLESENRREFWLAEDTNFEEFNRDPQGWSPVRLADVRKELFRLIDATPNLDWLLLTKRPEKIRAMWPSADLFDKDSEHKAYWPNVWLGTSISQQEHAEKQVPELLKCRQLAQVLFLSIEPMLGQIQLRKEWLPIGPEHDPRGDHWCVDCSRWLGQLDWVICGGESGPEAREFVLEYSLDLMYQCRKAGVAFFEKQLGAFPVTTNVNLWDFNSVCLKPWGDFAASARILLRDKSGGDPFEWPEQLRVREFPKVEVPA